MQGVKGGDRMVAELLLDDTDVKVFFDSEGKEREVLLSYEKYLAFVKFVEQQIYKYRQEALELSEVGESAGWDIFNSLSRDALPGRLPEASADHDTYLYGETL